MFVGNNAISLLTNENNYVLRVELNSTNGEVNIAEYSQFKLTTSHPFTLQLKGYNGTAGNLIATIIYPKTLSLYTLVLNS